VKAVAAMLDRDEQNVSGHCSMLLKQKRLVKTGHIRYPGSTRDSYQFALPPEASA
jgi:hypothetical protein